MSERKTTEEQTLEQLKRIADALEDIAHRLFHIEGIMKNEE